jgi:hypothetical protein
LIALAICRTQKRKNMSLGFDARNLAAAVEKIMELAITRRLTTQIVGVEKNFDITDRTQVEDYLMTKAQEIYDHKGPGVEAEIRDVVYCSLGVVYEANLGETHPPHVSRSTERPKHIVMFWQVL